LATPKQHSEMESELARAVPQIEARSSQLLSALSEIEVLVLRSPKEFAATQDSFALNVAGRLISQIEDALSPGYDENTCIVLLRVLRGMCLLHRPSRHLFDSDLPLQTLLAGVKHKRPEIQVSVIDTLVAVLVHHVEAIRRFEMLGGPKFICDVFKQSRTPTAVKLAILQFLFFYLVPETRYPNSQQKPPRLTTHDKQAILGRYLSNVDGLVRELEMNKPFGSEPIEW